MNALLGQEDLGVDRLVLMRGFEDMAGDASGNAEDLVIEFIESTAKELDLQG